MFLALLQAIKNGKAVTSCFHPVLTQPGCKRQLHYSLHDKSCNILMEALRNNNPYLLHLYFCSFISFLKSYSARALRSVDRNMYPIYSGFEKVQWRAANVLNGEIAGVESKEKHPLKICR